MNRFERRLLAVRGLPQIYLLVAAVALCGAGPSPRSNPVWPLEGRLTSDFGPRDGRAHVGIDVAASTGTPVASVLDGEVVWAGPRGNYGQLVEVAHPGGWSTRYAHLHAVDVEVGEWVWVGTTLGTVGATGNATGPHLHFEVRLEGKVVDPFEFLPVGSES